MFGGPLLGIHQLALAPHRDAVWSDAVARGASLVDTADVYGGATGAAERWLRGSPVPVATKGGLVLRGSRMVPDGRPTALVAAAERSRERLGVDALALWQWHAPDPKVDPASSLRGVQRILDRGIARAIGLCNPTVELLRRALDIVPVVSVQVELSPTRPHAVRSGVAEFARDRGVVVLAYRPFGGATGVAALRRNRTLSAVAARAGMPVTAVVGRWLHALGVVPLSGPTTLAHLDALWAHWGQPLDEALLATLNASFELGRLAEPRARRAPPADADGDVVVVMGRPGAGKSTAAGRFTGYLRLNRDERGGRLDGLLAPLRAALTSGTRRVVLDNTYPSRSSRNGVIEAAWACGAPARCEWWATTDDDAEVNVIGRILDRLGRLPEPGELVDPDDPALIPPRALHHYRERFEPPEVDEGFTRVDVIPFVRRPWGGAARVVLVDPRDLTERSAGALRAAQSDGFVIVSHGWAPAIGDQARAAVLERVVARGAALGLAIHAWSCPHPAGPPVCWCRKPYPGLAIAALRALDADPTRSFALIGSTADRSVARKLGLRALPQNP